MLRSSHQIFEFVSRYLDLQTSNLHTRKDYQHQEIEPFKFLNQAFVFVKQTNYFLPDYLNQLNFDESVQSGKKT